MNGVPLRGVGVESLPSCDVLSSFGDGLFEVDFFTSLVSFFVSISRIALPKKIPESVPNLPTRMETGSEKKGKRTLFSPHHEQRLHGESRLSR